MPDQASLPVHVPLVTEPLGMIASLRAAQANLLSILPKIATTQPMVSGRTGIRWHMVMDPKALRRVLLERVDSYPKSEATKSLLRPAIGESLFIAEGAHWRWQRRAAAPAFSARNIGALAPVMTAAAERASERLSHQTGRAADMMAEMVSTTFDVISDVTFSSSEGLDKRAVHRAIDAYIDEAARVSILDLLGAPGWVPRLGRLRGRQVLRETKALADRAIEERAARGPSAPPDLLDLLRGGADPETGRQMATEELRDNLLTFIVAGHETTALTLAWALYLCAFDPAIQDRARTEAQAALGSRAATVEDLGALPFIRQIIDETLRLYPPAGMLSRTAQDADILGGREIRPGDTVILPVYALHRNTLLWDEADAFRPDRFAEKPPRFSYLPFGDGPRVCIGAQFAIQEAVIVLATLLARFRFTPVAGRAPKPVLILTLRPEGGVWLKVEPT